MAPKRKQTNSDAAAAVASTRVLRSSTRPTKVTFSPEKPKPEPKKKKAKTAVKLDVTEAPVQEKKEQEVVEGSRSIVIEHCKQCNSFKTRALLVKSGLETAVPGVKVVVNPEKPRRGCLEIREEGGGIFISLLDMKRPFKAMKDLDMDKVVSDIVEKMK